MWVTEFSDDGVLQLFDSLEIVGIDDFIEEVSKEVQGTDIGESGSRSASFSLIWSLLETTLKLCMVALYKSHETSSDLST